MPEIPVSGSQTSEIVLYTADDGRLRIDVRMEDETVWLTQAQMAELFQTTKQNISLHINNAFEEGEVDPEATVKEYLIVQKERSREVSRQVKHYNLDVIISVGYRVKSLRGVQFRKWAAAVLREYLIKGFAMNDDLLKAAGGGGYWRELLDRIRDIRSSEKVLYRQVLDLYATSVDYDPRTEESLRFFKIVQNKLHYAAHRHTAAEVIVKRANADSPFMGLMTFSGRQPSRKDTTVAKNYLNEEELQRLNALVSAYFDVAEFRALEHKPMYMRDWIEQLDRLITSMNQTILDTPGAVSHHKAMEKAAAEYEKYRKKTSDELTPVERAYLETLDHLKAAQKKIERRERRA